MLGIPVPPVGVDAIGMDDLVRDTLAIRRGSGHEFVANRWRDMGLTVDAQGCGRRAGDDGLFAVVANGAHPTGIAVAISAAKAFHGRAPDPIGLVFCADEPVPAADRVVRLGSVGRGPAQWLSREAVTGPFSMLVDSTLASDVLIAGSTEGEVDYRKMQHVAVELAHLLERWITEGL